LEHGSLRKKGLEAKKILKVSGLQADEVIMQTRSEATQNQTASEAKPMICYLQVIGRNFVQESYDTQSGDARKRTTQLRKMGFNAKTQSMGMQVTSAGRCRMSLVTITMGRPGERDDIENLPTEGWRLERGER
jgi:hypothetical protein